MARVGKISARVRDLGLGMPMVDVYADFGEPGDNRYVRFRVQADDFGMLELHIDGEMCATFNDAPSVRIVMNGEEIMDTAEAEDVPQPREPLMPPRD